MIMVLEVRLEVLQVEAATVHTALNVKEKEICDDTNTNKYTNICVQFRSEQEECLVVTCHYRTSME